MIPPENFIHLTQKVGKLEQTPEFRNDESRKFMHSCVYNHRMNNPDENNFLEQLPNLFII